MTFPSIEESMLLRLYSLASQTSPRLDNDLTSQGLADRFEPDSEQSRGLQPVQLQILHPSRGSLVLRTYFGTWHRQDLPVLENAFMHFRQQPFLGSNFSSFSYDPRSTSCILGLYSGSSPLLIKSSMEQPLHPQVWQPLLPISVLRWDIGTTQTQDFLPPSVCLHLRQQYLKRFFCYRLEFLSSLLEREEEERLLIFCGELNCLFYNIMIQNSDIRFSYEQKDQYLTHQSSALNQRPPVGTLVSRRHANQPLDDQQDQLITKKSALLHGDNLNNSQVYSRIRFNRSRRETPKRELNVEKYSFNQELADSLGPKNEATSRSSNVMQRPKILPKVVPHSPEGMQSEISNVALTQSFIEERGSDRKGRSFSINHYDIYRPGVLVSRQQLAASRQKIKSRQSHILQKSGVVNGDSKPELMEEKPLPALNINFENATDRDLPQMKQPEASISHSKVFQKSERLNEGNPDSNLPSRIESEAITVQNPIKQRKGSSAHSKHTIKSSQKHGERPDPAVNQIDCKRQQKLEPKQPQGTESKQPQRAESNQLKRVEAKVQQRAQSKEQQRAESEAPGKGIKAKVNDTQIIKHIQILEQVEDPPAKDSRVGSPSLESKYEKSIPQLHQHPAAQQPQPTGARDSHRNPEAVEKQEKFVQQPRRGEEIATYRTTDNKVQQESHRAYEYHKFSSEDYTRVYQILKGIHSCLKTPVMDGHALLREIKLYLETVAGGSLDHIEGYTMPLHRLKIIKSALLYERIAIVIISFAYATGKIKECLKFLVNLVSYCTNNTLLILKILESCELEREGSKNPIIAKSDRLIMKRNYDTVRNGNDIILDAIFKICKTEEAFYDSFKDIVKSVGKNSLQQTFYNVLEYFSFFLCVSGLYKTIPFLAVAPNPYLRETIDKRPTLVIDIVEVFCHGTRKSKSHIFRPHTEYFLSQMSQYYEIVSFTCAYPNQIDKIIDILDPNGHIKHRLYRHHALTRHNVLFKDAERIGRDLRKIIVLDSQQNVVAGESGNTIMIPVWRGSKNDTILAELCPILATIAVKNMDCVQAVQKINQQHAKNQSAGIKYLNFGIKLD